MRTTATPAGPALPVARAKIVSSEDDAEDPDRESCGVLFMLEPTARRTAAGDGAPPAGCPWVSVAGEALSAVARRGCLLLLLLLLMRRCPVGYCPTPAATAVETVPQFSGDASTSADTLRSHGKPGRCFVRATSKLRRRHTHVGLERGGSRIALEVNSVAVAAVVLAVILGTKQCVPSADSSSSNSEIGRNDESPLTSISLLRAASPRTAIHGYGLHQTTRPRDFPQEGLRSHESSLPRI